MNSPPSLPLRPCPQWRGARAMRPRPRPGSERSIKSKQAAVLEPSVSRRHKRVRVLLGPRQTSSFGELGQERGREAVCQLRRGDRDGGGSASDRASHHRKPPTRAADSLRFSIREYPCRARPRLTEHSVLHGSGHNGACPSPGSRPCLLRILKMRPRELGMPAPSKLLAPVAASADSQFGHLQQNGDRGGERQPVSTCSALHHIHLTPLTLGKKGKKRGGKKKSNRPPPASAFPRMEAGASSLQVPGPMSYITMKPLQGSTSRLPVDPRPVPIHPSRSRCSGCRPPRPVARPLNRVDGYSYEP